VGLRLTFIGPPGCGKGTQAARLRAEGFLHVSSGDLLRAAIAAGSALGRQVAPVVAAGGLVADEVMFELVAGFIGRNAEADLVLDGYPRTAAQARHLATLGVDGAVFFEVDDALLLRRVRNRVLGPDGAIYDLEHHPPPPGVAVTRRPDDDPAVWARRLALYRQDEAPLRGFYAARGQAHAVDAGQSVAIVAGLRARPDQG
jgi:adenylate kinase